MSAEEELAKLKEELEKVKQENTLLKQQSASLKEKHAPSLRSRVCLADLLAKSDAFIGCHIGVGGWIKTAREAGGGKFAFLKLSDGTTIQELQIVVDGTVPGFSDVVRGSTGASIFAIGEIVPSKGKEQKVEMVASEIRLLGACDAQTYPMAKKAHSLEFLRQIGHLRPRSNVIGAVTRVRNALAFGTHNFFQSRRFLYIHTPLITASDCEGGGEMFQVTTMIKDNDFRVKTKEGKGDFKADFFGRPSYLTVSGQLNAEIYATALSNVYTFGPTFRAEESHTTRHLAEFWMIEPEIAFADLREDMDVAEAFLKSVIGEALAKCPDELAYLEDFEIKSMEEEEKAQKPAAKPKQEKKAKEPKAPKEAKSADKATKPEAAADKPAEAPAEKSAEALAEKPAAEKPAEKPAEAPAEPTSAETQSPPAEAKADSKTDKPQQQKPPQKQKPSQKQQQKQKQQPQKGKGAAAAPPKDWRTIPLRTRLAHVVNSQFARVTYTEAIDILLKAIQNGKEFKEPVSWGIDMASEHERYLCEVHFQKPTIVTNYPKGIKAFYMRLNDDGKTVAAMDILVPGVGEIIGGSQREERTDVLQQRIQEFGLHEPDYSWYLDLRRYGSVPHAGFGCGFERLVCYTTGIENIRDSIPFPRYPGHADF